MKTPEQMEMANKLEPVTWDEIKNFYKQNFNEALSENFRESFCYAWSISRKMPVIDLLATGFMAGYEAAVNSPEKQDSCKHILDMEKMVDVNFSSGWISVKERLPEEGQDCIFYVDFIDKWDKGSERINFQEIGVFNGKDRFDHRSHTDLDRVTYWMLLPKSPEEA
jgi:hypothetical protein